MADSIKCVACGHTIPRPPDDDFRWSVRCEGKGKNEKVVERHISILCPDCGVSETRAIYEGGREVFPVCYNLIVEPVDPPVLLSEYQA